MALFFNLEAVPFLFPHHPHPNRFCNALFNYGGRSTEHKRFLDENLQFKAGFKLLLKKFLVIKDNKEIFDTLHTAGLWGGRQFFRPMVVLTDFAEFNAVQRLRCITVISHNKSSKMRLYPTETIN